MTAFLYRRLAYHLDGTQVFLLGTFNDNYSDKDDVFTEPPEVADVRDFDPTALEAMNRLDGNVAFIDGARRVGMIFLFPTPMRIRGILPFGYPLHLWYSQDATEFADGTWTDMGLIPQTTSAMLGPPTTPPAGTGRYSADIRTTPPTGFGNEWDVRIVPTYPDEGIDNVALRHSWTDPYPPDHTAFDLGVLWKTEYSASTGGVVPYDMRQVTAMRFLFDPPIASYPATVVYQNLYLYGGPELGSWRNYMQVFDENFKDDTYAAQMDWGHAQWDSSADRGIRIKNQSPTHTASDIEVYFDPGHLTIPYVQADMFVMSIDGGKSWYSKVVISSLGPQALSTVIKIRRVTIEGDRPGPTQALIRTKVGDWNGYDYAPKTLQVYGVIEITSTASVPTARPAAGTVAITSGAMSSGVTLG